MILIVSMYMNGKKCIIKLYKNQRVIKTIRNEVICKDVIEEVCIV